MARASHSPQARIAEPRSLHVFDRLQSSYIVPQAYHLRLVIPQLSLMIWVCKQKCTHIHSHKREQRHAEAAVKYRLNVLQMCLILVLYECVQYWCSTNVCNILLESTTNSLTI